MGLAHLVADRRVVVCVGSGGVGKTTTAAALALGGARAGRRTLVLTIDPAKRLANSLGLDRLDHEERRVPDEKIAPAGEKVAGSLHAMMLDQKRAFDEIVDRYVADPAARERVRKNRIYQQISTTLAGSHEYAAMAKLCSIAEERRYDLIVLDTPPTANALDFLDAPDKLVGAVDSPAIQWFARLYTQQSLKVLGMGGAFILKRLAKFVGSRFLEDVAQFVGENGAFLTGFRDRAREVHELLRRPDVAFVLVCSPDPLSVDEALFFHARLRGMELPLGGFVVNRVHPRGPAPPSRGELVELLEHRPELRGYAPDDVTQVASDLDRTYRDFTALSEIDAREVQRLHQTTGEGPHIQVPLFDRDVYDVEGLTLIGKHLFGADQRR
jgi:anion-transporting  ArsA/GET3 family ATPase